MTTISFPSQTFPDYPGVSVDVPAGWSPLGVSGMLLAVARDSAEGEFRPNVVVSVSRFGAGYRLATAADAVAAKFASLEEAHEVGRDTTQINGVEWCHIESTFLDPRAGTLVQAAQVAIVDHGNVVDLVQVTGSVTGTQAHETALAEVRAIQRSVVLTTR